mmetsp:Transcript_35551/g.78165  ORF Transcript_35551/g.78165 Transcript_35551/m.78165 type:complete len:271 (-) Transcript_35551:28-840(-)
MRAALLRERDHTREEDADAVQDLLPHKTKRVPHVELKLSTFALSLRMKLLPWHRLLLCEALRRRLKHGRLVVLAEKVRMHTSQCVERACELAVRFGFVGELREIARRLPRGAVPCGWRVEEVVSRGDDELVRVVRPHRLRVVHDQRRRLLANDHVERLEMLRSRILLADNSVRSSQPKPTVGVQQLDHLCRVALGPHCVHVKLVHAAQAFEEGAHAWAELCQHREMRQVVELCRAVACGHWRQRWRRRRGRGGWRTSERRWWWSEGGHGA